MHGRFVPQMLGRVAKAITLDTYSHANGKPATEWLCTLEGTFDYSGVANTL
jgi:hypothetical protein